MRRLRLFASTLPLQVRFQGCPGRFTRDLGHLLGGARRELLYETPDGHVMAVSYTASHAISQTGGGDSFAAGKPRGWTEARLRNLGPAPNYDLAPGGKRLAAFVADKESDEKPLTQLTFLLNFFRRAAAESADREIGPRVDRPTRIFR